MEKISERLGIFAAIFTMLSIGASPHPFILIFCYIIHELGHILVAYLLGAKIKKFKVGSFHLSLSYDCSHLSYKKEMLVQFGGIALNIITSLFVLFIPFFEGECADFFVICSFSLALMNLYPASVLDGGGILKSFLLLKMEERNAIRLWKAISFLSVILMWLLSIYLQIVFCANLSLFVISIVLLVELCFNGV